MKRSQRIKAIVEIKAGQEKKALEALGESQRILSGMQAQLDYLKSYRLEYQEQFNRLGSEGMKIAKLLEFRSFIDKLDKAISGQEQSLRGIEVDLMAKRKIWEDMHHRTGSLQKVCDAALTEEIKHEAKLEQLEQDEWASRFFHSCQGSVKDAR